MYRRVFAVAAVLLFTLVGAAAAEESSIDIHIKDLKSEDPEIRANAAYELGCG